jgi:hypothetical protein
MNQGLKPLLCNFFHEDVSTSFFYQKPKVIVSMNIPIFYSCFGACLSNVMCLIMIFHCINKTNKKI